jgi:glycosyl transferase family 87
LRGYGSPVRTFAATDRSSAPSLRLTASTRHLMAGTGVVLVCSLALELAFFRRGGRHALGDIPGLFFMSRARTHAFPYVDARIQYPVFIGLAIWVAAWVGTTAGPFMFATFGMLATSAFLVVRLLRDKVGRYAWRFVLAPAFLLYALHNWDLLAVLAAVAALCAFDVGNDRAAGALLAIGASTKVFPGLMLIPLAAHRLGAGRRRDAVRLVVSAAVVAVVVNIPFALLSPSGWAYPLRFQGARRPSWASLWFYAFRLPVVRSIVAGHRAGAANVLAITTLLVALGIIAACAWKRRTDPFALGAATVAAFLLSNKVYSPNYDIWLAAFLPVVAWPAALRRAFGACTIAMFVAVFGNFRGFIARDVTVAVLPYIVVARAAVLVTMAAFALGLAHSRPADPVWSKSDNK